MIFRDRTQAGRLLAEELTDFAAEHPVIVGIPRGGIPVAYEVATRLDAPLDVIIVRKIGVPAQPELAMGAIGENGVLVVNEEVVRLAAVTPEEFSAVEGRERVEVERRAGRYRAGLEPVPLAGRTVIVVDDGIATGSTARAALQVLKASGAKRVVLAVPVAAAETLESLRDDADEVIAVYAPSDLGAIGYFYRDFGQTSDEDVIACLKSARA